MERVHRDTAGTGGRAATGAGVELLIAHVKPDTSQRVLVVDDNRDAAESLEILLELEHCKVSVACDGLRALEALDTFRPEIALLDIGMPGMDGYELARRIRGTQRGRDVLLVALTGWGQRAARAHS